MYYGKEHVQVSNGLPNPSLSTKEEKHPYFTSKFLLLNLVKGSPPGPRSLAVDFNLFYYSALNKFSVLLCNLCALVLYFILK